MTASAGNADPAEVARFDALASRWWDPAGEMRLLHLMNPVRAAWIAARAPLAGARVLDVGCGAGLLAEVLAKAGARVMGLDLAAESLAVARLHAAGEGLDTVEYRESTVEALAAEMPGGFDVVTCLEVLEHLPDPGAAVAACARALRPGGTAFFSTINRNARAWLVTVLGAEYVLGLLPKGTHDYARFIRPSELDRWARAAGLALGDIAGLEHDPAAGGFAIGADVGVNYIAHYRRRGP